MSFFFYSFYPKWWIWNLTSNTLSWLTKLFSLFHTLVSHLLGSTTLQALSSWDFTPGHLFLGEHSSLSTHSRSGLVVPPVLSTGHFSLLHAFRAFFSLPGFRHIFQENAKKNPTRQRDSFRIGCVNARTIPFSRTRQSGSEFRWDLIIVSLIPTQGFVLVLSFYFGLRRIWVLNFVA
jgi:hypothetical protein